MYKIITALGDEKINKKIKEKENYEVICSDIQYQDGVLEILENKKEIDFLILSEMIPGEYDIYEFITKIKEKNEFIEIIIILEKENINLKKFLNTKGVFNIFYNNQITFEELIKIIKNQDINIENNTDSQAKINEELNMLKKMILQKQEKKKIKIIKSIKIINMIKNKLNKYLKKKNSIKIKNKIISVVGSGGVGKSSFCSIFSKVILNKKILIVDFDILNSSINSIFNIKKHSTKRREKSIKTNDLKIKQLIFKINKNIDILSGMEILIDEEYKVEKEKFSNILKELTTIYDLIIIDTSSECFLKYTKEILKKSELIIFLVEPNLIELKKSKNLLDIYINKWKIKKEKFNIIFNKINSNSIEDKILKSLFSEFNILGNIKLNIKYNLIINKNQKIIDKKIKKEYLKIIKKLKLEGEKNNE